MLIQLAQVRENSQYPGGKGGGGGKVQQKFRYPQPVSQSQPDKIPVGNAISGYSANGSHQIHQQPLFFNLQLKVIIGIVDACQKIVHPVLQTENPNVLGKLDGF